MAISPGGASIVWALIRSVPYSISTGSTASRRSGATRPKLVLEPLRSCSGATTSVVVPGPHAGFGQRRQARRGDTVVVRDQPGAARPFAGSRGGSGGGSGIGAAGWDRDDRGGPGGWGSDRAGTDRPACSLRWSSWPVNARP